MTKTPDLTLPLARLTLFCGHAFTLIRAECWTGMTSGNKPTDSLDRIQSTADTVHNLAAFGWHIGEYTQGRASGRALIDTGAHLIRALKVAEQAQGDDIDEAAAFDWADARVAVEEIVAEIEIQEILGDDVPTTSEHMANVMADMRTRTLKGKKQ